MKVPAPDLVHFLNQFFEKSVHAWNKKEKSIHVFGAGINVAASVPTPGCFTY